MASSDREAMLRAQCFGRMKRLRKFFQAGAELLLRSSRADRVATRETNEPPLKG